SLLLWPRRPARSTRVPYTTLFRSGGFLASVDFHPVDFALAAVCLLNCSIHDLDHHGRNVRPRTITLDVGDDGLIRHVQGKISIDRDFLARRGHLDVLVGHECSCYSWGLLARHQIAAASMIVASHRARRRTVAHSSAHSGTRAGG